MDWIEEQCQDRGFHEDDNERVSFIKTWNFMAN
jgi:hypothetical protein